MEEGKPDQFLLADHDLNCPQAQYSFCHHGKICNGTLWSMSICNTRAFNVKTRYKMF